MPTWYVPYQVYGLPFLVLSDIPELLSGLTQAIPKLGDKELKEEGACEIWEIF